METNHSDNDNTRTYIALTKGTMVSHYRIIKRIGAGGMGVVYLAKDTALDRKVALKFLPAQYVADKDLKARFIREAKATAKLNHPNIVTIYEVSEFKGQPFFAMELVEGERLRHTCHGEPLPINKIVDLATQLCEGLSKAHQEGIVHRDIKTANIIVDHDGRPKILDFGLASIIGAEKLTKVGSTIGTVAYMSPEQAQGRTADHRSDLFSFGIVLYELITGRTPFKRDSDMATLKAITSETAEPLARYRSNTPEELQRIVSKLLQHDPALRYQSAEGVISDLKLLAVSDSLPSVPSIKQKSNVWFALSGILVVLVIAIFIFLYFQSREKAEESGKIPMLVVLPFDNLGLEEDRYFADGMTDEITSRLAGIQGLGVISRTSAMLYRGSGKTLKEIGNELGVDFVLEGTVRWSKMGPTQKVRITPQLIRVSDDRHLWADNFERELTEVFEVQTEIATNIVEALGITLLEPEHQILSPKLTDNMAAYDSYLQGIDYINRGYNEKNFRTAVEMFKRAVELDPNFAVAYAKLSHSYNVLVFYFSSLADVENSEKSLAKALEINPYLSEAHLALGSYHTMWTMDYVRAREEFEQASRGLINSSDLYHNIAILDKREGKWEQSLSNAHRALELDPRSTSKYEDLANTYFVLRNYSEANRFADRFIALSPDNNELYYWKIWIALHEEGELEAARQIIAGVAEHVDPVDIMWNEYMTGLHILGLWRFGLLQGDLQNLPDKFASSFDGSRKQVYYISMAQIYEFSDKQDLAAIFYDSTRIILENFLEKYPDEFHYNTELSLTYAFLGRIDEAIERGLRAKELLPIEKCHW